MIKGKENNSISKNYFYNLMYQILLVIIPLILMPYLSRTLLPEGTGKYSFITSIVSYFSLFSLLGISLYGTKEISTKRGDSESEVSTFWEIFKVKGVFSIVSIILFIIITFFIENNSVYFIHGFILIANLIDITWYYMGRENFKVIAIKNGIIKVIAVILIFIFVKKPDDLWIYALILSSSEVAGQLFLWVPEIRKGILKGFGNNIKKNRVKHIKGLFIMFLPQIVIILYTSLTTTILGLVTTDVELGYFDMSNKIINLLIVIVTSLGMIVLPKITKLNESKDKDKIRTILSKIIEIMTYFVSILIVFLIIISPTFVPWYLGEDYIPTVQILQISSIKILLVLYSNVIGIQYLVSTNQIKQFLISVVIGAVVGISSNVLLSMTFKAYGAAISLILSESVVLIAQIILTRKQMDFFRVIINQYKTFITAILVGAILYLIDDKINKIIFEIFGNINYNLNMIITIGIKLIIGLLLYLLLNTIFRNKIQKVLINKIIKNKNKTNYNKSRELK